MTTQASDPSPRTTDSTGNDAPTAGRFRAKDFSSRTGLIWIWVAMAAVFAIIEPNQFLQSGTFKTIFGTQFELVFMGVALITTFVVGEFDLSVASTLGLAATLVPLLVSQHGWSPLLASIVAVGAAGVVGVVNAFVVVVIGVDAIVTTLGMATFVLGVALWVTNLNSVEGLSASYSELALRNVLGLPIAFWYSVAACLVLGYVLWMTPLGRRMTFVGSSREVARLAGINVNRLRFGSYVVSGLVCGVGGVLLTASLGGYDPSTSPQYLLPALAAVFLGTSVIVPGRFNPIGTFVAVYFLQTGIIGLELRGLTGWIEDVFYGGALVLAVAATKIISGHRGT